MTIQDLLDDGWKQLDVPLIETKRVAFEKGNYFLIFDSDNNLVIIILKDPSLDFDKVPNPEHFRVYFKCYEIITLKTVYNILITK